MAKWVLNTLHWQKYTIYGNKKQLFLPVGCSVEKNMYVCS